MLVLSIHPPKKIAPVYTSATASTEFFTSNQRWQLPNAFIFIWFSFLYKWAFHFLWLFFLFLSFVFILFGYLFFFIPEMPTHTEEISHLSIICTENIFLFFIYYLYLVIFVCLFHFANVWDLCSQGYQIFPL